MRSGYLPRSGCHPRSGCLPRSGCHPRSVRHPRSVCHLTPGLSVTRPPVCPSPDFGLSVTQLWTVRHPTLVCPSPNLGLSVTQPLSVHHPTLVCPSPDLRLDGFTHDPSQSPSSEHGPGQASGRSRPPSFQPGGWGLLSCSYVGGWDCRPFSVPGGPAGFAPAWLSCSGQIYL